MDQAPRKKTILVVDDEPEVLSTISGVLVTKNQRDSNTFCVGPGNQWQYSYSTITSNIPSKKDREWV
jgi:CheY-like chemotaxis protein